MLATAVLLLPLIFSIQNIVLAIDQNTNYSKTSTEPTNQHNPLEHLLLNQNGNKQVDGQRVKREGVDPITNAPEHHQSSTESNIEKIPPNSSRDLTLDGKGNEEDASSKSSVRVKRQYYPYPVYYERRRYFPVPFIFGGGGFPIGGFGRGFGGRGFGGSGFGGRGFGGRGIGGRGFGGGHGGFGGGHGGFGGGHGGVGGGHGGGRG